MKRKNSHHLLDRLAEIPDPRNKKSKRYPLKAFLGLLIVAILAGHKGYTSIATWGRGQPAVAKALGFKLIMFP